MPPISPPQLVLTIVLSPCVSTQLEPQPQPRPRQEEAELVQELFVQEPFLLEKPQPQPQPKLFVQEQEPQPQEHLEEQEPESRQVSVPGRKQLF